MYMYNTCQIWGQLQCNVIYYKYYYLKNRYITITISLKSIIILLLLILPTL